AARSGHVEERLQQRGRDERRVGRALDAPLREEEPHDVASTSGNDRIHPGACDVRAEHLAPAHGAVGVRRVDDVPPSPRDRKELAEVAEDPDREPLPLDRSKVVEEDPDRVEDGVDHGRSVADAPLEVASASAAPEITAAEAHPAAEVAPAASCIVPIAEAARRSGAAPAAVAPAAIPAAQQLADEESGEESRPAEWHEVAARPRPEIGQSASVRA